MEQRYDKETGLPVDRAYLECGLPPYLQRSLDTMKRAWEAEDNGANDLHFDAYYCELQADINSAEVEGEISSAQAWYLRETYLRIQRGDFTNLPRRNKTYGGANGSKRSVIYQDEQYMLKFPPHPSRNRDMSYANSCLSEYLGCHIFALAGIPVQETLPGTYTYHGKEKIVVACKDFTSPGVVLQDFASMKNQVIDSERNGYGTELDDILFSIHEQPAIDPKELEERFWDMFIVDALIGNWDRHNGNWGVLYDTVHDMVALAPVFDCGSCLYPQLDEGKMQAVLSDPREMDFRVYEIPLSGIKQQDKKIRYFDFLSSLEYEGCNAALKRIGPRLDMEQICRLIDETPCLSGLQRRFYKEILALRKERIIDYSLQRLQERERSMLPGHTKKPSRDTER